MNEKKNKWKFVYSKIEIDGNEEIRERLLEKHIALFNLLGSSGWELVPEFSQEDVYCFRKNKDMTFQYIWKMHISLSNTCKINLDVEKMSDTANEMEKEGFRLVLLKDTYFCFMKAE